MPVSIHVDNEEALVDDVIIIKVKGLSVNQPITVRAQVTEKGNVFAGTGCFISNNNGEVDLSQDASVHGTYTGKGPFPAVIDMFGTAGSCIEFRAALFASRGFASLALPYFLYDDLPDDIEQVELEYFLEAVDWFSKHPDVDADNIGVIGVSKGGEIALHMGYYCDKIKSIVSINGAPFFTTVPMLYKGELIGKSIFKEDRAIQTEEGIEVRHTMDCDIVNYLPIWEKDVKVLLICGLDDRCLNDKILSNLYDSYPPERKHLCELHKYLGGGHLIEPPYAPLARSTSKHNRGVLGDFGIVTILWGGETVGHAFAQEDSWKHILQHFRSTLSSSNVKSTKDTKSDILNSKL